MTRYITVLVVALVMLSACTCLDCETLSPEEIERFSTAMAVPFQEPADSENALFLICYGDLEADAWDEVSDLMQAIADGWTASVVVMQADAVMLEGEPSFENLELESLPACLLFDREQEEVFRTYDDFSLETFEEQLGSILGG